MHKLLGLLALLALLAACSDPSQVFLSDDNQDAVAHLSPDPQIMGNAELFFIPGTIQGSAIWVINGPAANVGIDIRDIDNPSFIYFADSFISAGSNKAQTGTQIPWNKWMRVRLVVYESGLAGWVAVFLDSLGLDFFENLEDYMIEAIYEADIHLSSGGTKTSLPVRKIK